LDGTIAATYQKRMTDKSKEEILAMMDEETWFDAEAAVEAGLADEIFDGTEEAPDGDGEEFNLVRRFKKRPTSLVVNNREPARLLAEANRTAPDDSDDVELRFRWAQLNAGRAA
jgi:hypothetical protein